MSRFRHSYAQIQRPRQVDSAGDQEEKRGQRDHHLDETVAAR
jgi:hypothetical protein